jgi:cytochrome c oxidase cbb3-type subunit 3
MCSRSRDWLTCSGTLLATLIVAGCAQDADRASAALPGGKLIEGNRQIELQPGPPLPAPPVKNPYEGNEQALADGKRIYNQFNCSGCHAAGGGAIGPPLMDDEWIYGSKPQNVFWTIIEGRPQGMPAYGGRIAEDQVWRLVAYVRSLSDLPKKDEAKRN